MRISRLIIIAAVITMFCLAGIAEATTISFTNEVPPPPITGANWHSDIMLQRFNPAWGTLNSVTITGLANIGGQMKCENLSLSSKQGVTLSLKALVHLDMPTVMSDLDLAPTMSRSIPSLSEPNSIKAFDGKIDYAGDSGRSWVGLPTPSDTDASKSDSRFTNDAAAMAFFVGDDSFAIPVYTTGQSYARGDTGNLATWFKTISSANATVTYDYTAVPEMGSTCLAVMGLLGLPIWRRRKRG